MNDENNENLDAKDKTKQTNKQTAVFAWRFSYIATERTFRLRLWHFRNYNYLGNTGTDVLRAAETNPPLGRFYVGRGRVSETVVK